jgi:hypothetical protein
MRRKPHSTSLILLLTCIFAFWWGISVLSQSAAPSLASNNSLTPTENTPPSTLSNTAALVVHETMNGTTRTYSGTFMPANACDSFGSGIRYNATAGGQISILLITSPASTACAQAAGDSSSQPFSVSIKLAAGSNPGFGGVLLNGTSIPAQLVQDN